MSFSNDSIKSIHKRMNSVGQLYGHLLRMEMSLGLALFWQRGVWADRGDESAGYRVGDRGGNFDI